MRSRINPTFAVVSIAALVSYLGSFERAQAQTPQTPPQVCMDLLHTLPAGATTNDVFSALAPSEAAACIMKAAFPNDTLKANNSLEVATGAKAQTRSNAIQSGASTGANGTTSAISKPFSPLSLATEYGGITSSTSNQTVTFQIPLDGIPRGLATSGGEQYCAIPSMAFGYCVKPSLLDTLDRFSFSVSMNTSAATNAVTAAATGASTSSAQQVTAKSQGGGGPSFSGATAKVVLVKPTAQLPTFGNTPLSTNAAQNQSPKVLALNSLLQGTKYDVWRRCFANAAVVTGADRDAIATRFFNQLGQIIRSEADVTGCPEAMPTATRSVEQAALLAALRDIVLSMGITEANFNSEVFKALGAPVLSFEYDYATPQNQESNSTFKLIGSKGWFAPTSGSTQKTGAPSLTGTLNVGASIFNATPSPSVPGASLLRTLQAGAELDYIVPTSKLPGFLGKIGDSTTALAYYYQDQASPSILKVTPGTPLTGITLVGLSSTATQIFAQKGPIQVGQFKYGFGTGKNVKFPFAVTYASRTELIVRHAWGAQFGVSYDFTSLFSGSGSGAGGGHD
jgi:hypothetical protein